MGPPQGGQGLCQMGSVEGDPSNNKNNEKQISHVKMVFQTRRGQRPECTHGTGLALEALVERETRQSCVRAHLHVHTLLTRLPGGPGAVTPH